MKANKRAIRLTVRAGAVAVCVLAASFLAAAAGRAANPTYTVCIDIPFHPLFDYLAEKSDTIFAGKPYTVKFKVLDAKTQVPAFGAGQCDVMTTPPSFIPRVTDQYHLNVAEFFPLARWTIGPQILVKKGSPYTTLASLKGKKVAITPLNTRFGSEEAAIEAATGENIRTYFDLKETNAAAQELTLGRVDAAFIEAPTTYPLLEGGKFKAIYSVHDAFLKAFGDPAVVNGGYIARTDFIKQHPGIHPRPGQGDAECLEPVRPRARSRSTTSRPSRAAFPPSSSRSSARCSTWRRCRSKLRAITPQDVKTLVEALPAPAEVRVHQDGTEEPRLALRRHEVAAASSAAAWG